MPNVWLGVSVEDQATADERIPLLLDTPAAVRFVSYEPALGPVDLRKPCPHCLRTPGFIEMDEPPYRVQCGCALGTHPRETYGLDWVIVGGESGKGHRDLDMAWVESVYGQCEAAGIAYFGKQREGARSGQPLPAPYDRRSWPVLS